MALNIKHTLTSAISGLKEDIHSMAHCITDIEQTSHTHAEAIRQVQKAYDSQLPHNFDLHRQVEDLDNRGRRHKIGADSPIALERLDRTLRPPFPQDSEAQRDVVCCIVNFPLKEEILHKARLRGHVLFNGTDINLFQDLSQISLL